VVAAPQQVRAGWLRPGAVGLLHGDQAPKSTASGSLA